MKREQPIDLEHAVRGAEMMLSRLGFDTASDGLKETPARVVRAMLEMTNGYDADIESMLSTEFDSDYDQAVVLRKVPFYSLCEHHLLPFFGMASVAYIPAEGRVVGLSKLARLVEAHARRLQIQERLTRDVAADIEKHLKPVAVGVVITAQHLCMCARGVEKPGAEMLTSDLRGAYRDTPHAKAEALRLMGY